MGGDLLGAVVYALAPYHFRNGVGHENLAFYVCIPYIVVLCVRLVGPSPPLWRWWQRGPRRFSPVRSLWPLAAAALIAFDTYYYLAFFLGLGGLSALLGALHRRRRTHAALARRRGSEPGRGDQPSRRLDRALPTAAARTDHPCRRSPVRAIRHVGREVVAAVSGLVDHGQPRSVRRHRHDRDARLARVARRTEPHTIVVDRGPARCRNPARPRHRRAGFSCQPARGLGHRVDPRVGPHRHRDRLRRRRRELPLAGRRSSPARPQGEHHRLDRGAHRHRHRGHARPSCPRRHPGRSDEAGGLRERPRLRARPRGSPARRRHDLPASGRPVPRVGRHRLRPRLRPVEARLPALHPVAMERGRHARAFRRLANRGCRPTGRCADPRVGGPSASTRSRSIRAATSISAAARSRRSRRSSDRRW